MANELWQRLFVKNTRRSGFVATWGSSLKKTKDGKAERGIGGALPNVGLARDTTMGAIKVNQGN
jgi:hypothetical protein